MEWMLLLMVGAIAGAAFVMNEENSNNDSDMQDQEEENGSNQDQRNPPNDRFVPDDSLQDITAQTLQRWAAEPLEGADLTLLTQPEDEVINLSYRGTGNNDDISLDPLEIIASDEVGSTGWVMELSSESGDDDLAIWFTPKDITRDHAYAIYAGDDDDDVQGGVKDPVSSEIISALISNGAVFGGAGDDHISFDATDVFGGSGEDHFQVSSNNERVFGGDGDDIFILRALSAEQMQSEAVTEIYGGDGADFFDLSVDWLDQDTITTIHDFEVGIDALRVAMIDTYRVAVNEVEDGTELIFESDTNAAKSIIWLNNVTNFDMADLAE